MPVTAENQKLYPGGSLRSPEWLAIRKRILERSGSECEVPSCSAENGKPHPVSGSKVVLTIAHLDWNPENSADNNLKALCQMCHNRYDGPIRKLHAAETRRRKKNNLEIF